mgnify:CR=1 FL=1
MKNSIEEQSKSLKTKKVKVLMITRLCEGEGPTTVLDNLVEYLERRNIEVSFLAVASAKINNEKFKRVKYLNNADCIRGKMPEDFWKYDIYHFHGAFLWQFPIIAKKLNGKPYLITFHGNLAQEALKFHYIRKQIYLTCYAKRFLSGACAFHALSNNEKKDINRVIVNPTWVIPNGVKTNVDLSCNSAEDSSVFSLIYLGRIDVQHKGIDYLFDAMEIVLRRDENIVLDVFGGFNSKSDKKWITRRLKKSTRLSDHIRFHGKVFGWEKYNALNNSKVFILTSRYEGMPMAALEAMQVGIPIIVSTQTNLADIVYKSGAGRVVELNPTKIADAICEFKSLSKSELNNLGKAGEKYVKEYMNWNEISFQYRDMYKELGEF